MTMQHIFEMVDLNGKILLIWERGELIGNRTSGTQGVNLYAMPGFLVEVYYTHNVIHRVEILHGRQPAEEYLEAVSLEELFV